MSLKRFVFSAGTGTGARDFGLLLLRLGLGGVMLANHGLAKLQGFSEMSEKFPDPFGFLGSQTSLILAMSAEFGCSILVILGLATRLATIPLIVTMSVAFFMIHANDPFQVKELALIYLIGFVALFFTGPGRISADAKIGG